MRLSKTHRLHYVSSYSMSGRKFLPLLDHPLFVFSVLGHTLGLGAWLQYQSDKGVKWQIPKTKKKSPCHPILSRLLGTQWRSILDRKVLTPTDGCRSRYHSQSVTTLLFFGETLWVTSWSVNRKEQKVEGDLWTLSGSCVCFHCTLREFFGFNFYFGEFWEPLPLLQPFSGNVVVVFFKRTLPPPSLRTSRYRFWGYSVPIDTGSSVWIYKKEMKG